jgi:hypothetical protein
MIFSFIFIAYNFNMLNNINATLQSQRESQIPPTTWSQKSQEATDLVELFRQYDEDNNTGVSPYYTKTKDVLENVYNPIEFLHKFKKDRFYNNYKNLVRAYELEKNKRRGTTTLAIKPIAKTVALATPKQQNENTRLASKSLLFLINIIHSPYSYYSLFFFLIGEAQLKPSPSPPKRARSGEEISGEQDSSFEAIEEENFDICYSRDTEESSDEDEDSDEEDYGFFETPFHQTSANHRTGSRDENPSIARTDVDILAQRMKRMETPGKAARAPVGAKGPNYMKTNHPNIKYMFDDERGQHLITYEIFLPGGITDNNNIKIHIRESKKGSQTLVVVHPLPSFLFRSEYFHTNCEIEGQGDTITSASRHLARKRVVNGIALEYGDGSGSTTNVLAEMTFKLPFRVDDPWDRHSYVEKYRHTGHNIRSYTYMMMRQNAAGQSVKVLRHQEVLVVTLVAERKVESGFNTNATPVRGSLPIMVVGDVDQDELDAVNFEVEELNNRI